MRILDISFCYQLKYTYLVNILYFFQSSKEARGILISPVIPELISMFLRTYFDSVWNALDIQSFISLEFETDSSEISYTPEQYFHKCDKLHSC